MLEAFASGVTDGGTLGLRRRPHEFAILRSHPTPWTSADVLGIGKLQNFANPSNWDVELARLKILTEDGAEALEALDPTYPDWHPVSSPPGAKAGKAIERLAEDAAKLSALVGLGGGSNNWALAPERTATGRPLLANNPHLPPSLPSYWYLVHLHTPEWAVAGACFVGSPSIAAGHNGFAAWGVTNGFVDNTDLFLEKIGDDGCSVYEGDKFVPCGVRTEHIKVKGARPVTEEVLETPRGPIIGPALEGEVGAVSLRAVWLDPLPVQGLLGLHRVRSFEEFRQALALWPSIPLNMVYADETGTVGWQLMGQAPRRRKGWGTMPLPGWETDAGWEEALVLSDEMPYSVSPTCGFVATANNQPVPEGTGPFLGIDWLEGFRQARIVEVLSGRSDWDVSGVQRLQTDIESVAWREMRRSVLNASERDPASRKALEVLRAWDGQVAADSPAATIYELLVSEMAHRIAAAKAPKSHQWVLGCGFTPFLPFTAFSVRRVGHLTRVLRDRPEGWFKRPWEDEVADALSTIVRRLEATRGEDSRLWAWGRIRPLTLRHPFGDRKPFDRIFNLGPICWGGDGDTVGAAWVNSLDPTANPLSIDSLRMVVDVGIWQNSRFVLPGGQSGNPLSPHYSDQFPLWQRGESIPIPWSDAEVAQATRETLQLRPVSFTD
jgi:penicillin amidase